MAAFNRFSVLDVYVPFAPFTIPLQDPLEDEASVALTAEWDAFEERADALEEDMIQSVHDTLEAAGEFEEVYKHEDAKARVESGSDTDEDLYDAYLVDLKRKAVVKAELKAKVEADGKVLKPCRYGAKCWKLKKGTCTFGHTQTEMEKAVAPVVCIWGIGCRNKICKFVHDHGPCPLTEVFYYGRNKDGSKNKAKDVTICKNPRCKYVHDPCPQEFCKDRECAHPHIQCPWGTKCRIRYCKYSYHPSENTLSDMMVR